MRARSRRAPSTRSPAMERNSNGDHQISRRSPFPHNLRSWYTSIRPRPAHTDPLSPDLVYQTAAWCQVQKQQIPRLLTGTATVPSRAGRSRHHGAPKRPAPQKRGALATNNYTVTVGNAPILLHLPHHRPCFLARERSRSPTSHRRPQGDVLARPPRGSATSTRK